MKIALFGATGKTGQQFLEQALAAGYSIKALVRDPEKLKQQHPKLEVIKGDVLDRRSVSDAVAGTDVVVSLFGHVKDSPEWLQTEGTKTLIEAMKQHSVRKIISLSGGGLPYAQDKPKLPDYLIRGIMKLFVPKILNDAKRHAEVLASGGVDWVIVRAPRLTDESRRGNYRVGWVGVNASTQIGRADLADFILKQVQEEKFIRQMPFVSY